ncbi:hypothetical protein [Sphingosinithalassobacter portus]|uniref:hypothetical protein n=1 Tax=Stakelama portus TaxID=2676234 RepID=UPI000D6E0FE7|nr:hypothetical protein [Sphingosinithalassobacter portus]
MAEFFVFLYAMATGFVLVSLQRNQRQQRPNSQMVTMMGWGLFSLSSTLAVLMAGLAVAIAMGMPLPIANAPLLP